MSNKHDRPEDSTPLNNSKQILRQHSEEMVRENALLSSENIEALSLEESRQILHELQVHQIELEMQNEELQRTQRELDASRDLYLNFYDLSPVGYFTLSDQGLIQEANLTAAGLLGLPRDSLYGQPLTSFILPEDQDTFYLNRKQLSHACEPQTCELRMVKTDGTFIWAHLATTAAADPNGAPVSRIVMSDITVRKQADAKIKRDETRLKRIVDILQHPSETIQDFLDYALDQAIQLTESKIGYIYHYHEDRKEFVLNTWSRDVMAECAIANPSTCYELDKTGIWGEAIRQRRAIIVNDYPGDNPLKKGYPQGHVQLFKFMTVPIFKDGGIVGVVGLANKETDYEEADILQVSLLLEAVWKVTDRKKAVEALGETERKYQELFELSPVGIFKTTSTGQAIFVNPEMARILGANSPQEAVDNFKDLAKDLYVDPNRRKEFIDLMKENGDVENFEYEAKGLNGKHLWLSMNARTREKLSDGSFIIDGFTTDITERKQAELELRESEEKFRLTFSSSPDAVAISRLDNGLYVDINEGFTRATGYTREEVIGKTTSEKNIWHDPSDRERMVQGLREKGVIENLEAQFRMKDGSLITALMSAKVISLKGVPHLISIVRDITERKLTEAKFQQAQKFEAIGTLAGGVAHDFNNLLMGIQGRASLISWDLEISHPHREHILAIEEYICSAASLTQQLLGFARGGKYEVKPVDINELVHGSSVMFGRTKKEIRIHAKYQASTLVVEADKGQIEQVLLNIYINAWQAMPPDGGDLYLETKIVMLDEVYCNPHQVKPGCYVKISITDTGVGMDEATRQRIFDPFFTTKEMGRGTGLGLASAYGIIKNHGGLITVYSEVGLGTTFNIYLPVSDKVANQEVPREGGLIKGSATILLVDDEELIIDVGQAMLERLGYRVMVCRGGQEAVKVIADMGNKIDLVILDMIMPGMDGGTTFDRIREIQPGIPVILSSGYAINGHADEIMRRGCNGFIQKPYNISDLSNKVRTVLDESTG